MVVYGYCTYRVGGFRKTGGRSQASLDSNVSGQLRRSLQRLLTSEFFQFRVAPLQDFYDPRVEAGAGFRSYAEHGLIQGQRLAALAIRRQCVEAIDGGENARSDWNGLALQTARIAAAIPFFIVCANNGHHRVGKVDLFENLRPNDGMDLHLFKLFWGQFSWLRDDVFRDRKLAYVIQNLRGARGLRLVLGQ